MDDLPGWFAGRCEGFSLETQIGLEYLSYHSSIWCAPFEALHGRKCRSLVLWAKIGESGLTGPELVLGMTDKVEVEVGDRILLKGVAYEGRIVRFLKKVKLAPSYKCLVDASLHVPLNEIKVDKTLRFIEEPVEILDREIRSLKRSKISLVKVCWDLKRGPEFLGAGEDYIKSKYPQFFIMYEASLEPFLDYAKLGEYRDDKKDGLVDPEFPKKVYKVEKALYGLHQAPKAWYETLSTYLLDNRFYRGQIDKTLFIRRVKGGILLMSSMGELTFFLGLEVKKKEVGIFISQDKYVGQILKKFSFSSIRTASTPMETNKALTKDEDGEDVDVHLYRGGGSPRRQETMGGATAQTRSERVLEKPNEPPLSEGNTSGSGEGRMEHQFEVTANVPITSHDSPLPGGYIHGSDEEKTFKRSRQKKDSKALKPRRRKYRYVKSSDDDLNEEDASKQGRIEKKYPLIKELLEKMLNLQLEAKEVSTMAFELIKLIKSNLEK
ncbi:putative ribonuclease H-like domain-containing protein [Tanacetum coccineum]